MRTELREIQTGVTMILVTHDQSEAMSFADEIVVMKDGLLPKIMAYAFMMTPQPRSLRPSLAKTTFSVARSNRSLAIKP